jgi:hypothetical protein
VFQALDHAMSQGLDIAWWQLFASLDNEVGLVEVQEWLSERQCAP